MLQSRLTGSDNTVTACSGYAGQASYEFINRSSTPAEAQAHCLTDFPSIGISIKHRDYIKLQIKRLEAIDRGVLNSTDADYVPAHISFGDKIYKAQVRLKGDWSHHVSAPNRWSLRVVLSGDDNILGRKRFSLQTFEMRGHEKDPLYSQHLAFLDLLAPRYKPMHVTVNSEDWGTMVMEDHFNTELVEARQRKDSIIARFDESSMWTHRIGRLDYGPYDNAYTSPYKPFRSQVVKRSPLLLHYNAYTQAVLTAWQEGRLPLADIVDLEKYADFIIASEAWDGWHTFRWHNMRFYLNPYTMKLEPVPFDNGWGLWPIDKPPIQARVSRSQILAELLDSPAFWAVLERRMPIVLEQMADPRIWRDIQSNNKYLRGLLKQEGDAFGANLKTVRRNMARLTEWGPSFFKRTMEKRPPAEIESDRLYHSMVKVSMYDNGTIALSNKLTYPVVVEDVRVVSDFGSISVMPPELPIISLPPTELFQRPQVFEFQSPEVTGARNVEVSSRNPVTGQVVIDNSNGVIMYFSDSDELDSWSPESLSRHGEAPQFVERSSEHWRIPEGHWELHQNLVVPANTTLTISAGAHISVDQGHFILSHGAVNIGGSAERPVRIQSSGDGLWNGIYLINTSSPSSWQHVQLENMAPFTADNFSLSGAVNFYQSDINLEQISIRGVQAEDAINVVRSQFSITGLHLDGTTSDAIDSDFSNGSIAHSHFENIGGDGIDTSGSNISIADTTLRVVADKAISIGEASEVRIQNTRVDNTGVGIAAKDYSRATIHNLSVSNARVAAVMAYSKKAEYGGAWLDIEGLTVKNSKRVINQLGSTVILDGESIPARRVNVDYYYQQGLMPK